MIELAACPALVDDALAVCTGLLTRFDRPWFAPVCDRVAGEGAATHRARLTAFACISHTGEQLSSAMDEFGLDDTASLIAQALIALLRRRRDVGSRARGTIDRMLQTHFAYARSLLEELAQKGHYHAQLHARRILEYAGIEDENSGLGEEV